ncbi:androgen-induced gene 1 protein isoform X4 [Chiroxiphia lanceolata]|uniref:androgen-induced gene 1 protein isoform X4 n=1 Tax=Chiroxiphia lanceolata TaxID=296741 RepID=UPI0013CEA622|nr:androgen-induced gene 1 protein isoform X4 [Chiroxiphia lanceolata]
MALVPCQVLRAAILLSYCSILCNYKAIDMPAHQTYGGSWKFLTFIDLGAFLTFSASEANAMTVGMSCMEWRRKGWLQFSPRRVAHV